MNEVTETKMCPFCAETIKAAARKCPFCNSSQAPYGLLRQEFSLAVAYVMVLGVLVFALVEVLPTEDQGGRSFARHRRDLQVSQVTVDLVRSGTSAFDYSVSGFVTNRGEYPWRVREISFTISNAVGASDARNSAVEPFVVQPHTGHAFAFRSYSVLTNTVVAARAWIADARDGDLPAD